MNHLGSIEEIAKAAATEYGQDWATLPYYSRDIWREAVRQTERGGGQTEVERCAGRAIEQWYQALEPAPVKIVEEKPKKTRGGK